MIELGQPPVIVQEIPAWNAARVQDLLRDLDGDGNPELVVAQAFSEYEGANACVAHVPTVFTCSSGRCLGTTTDFQGYYIGELESRSRRVQDLQDSGASADGRLSCVVMERDKLQRRLAFDARAGFQLATQWMASADPLLRKEAVAVFADIGGSESRARLEVLRQDPSGAVATSAQSALERQR